MPDGQRLHAVRVAWAYYNRYSPHGYEPGAIGVPICYAAASKRYLQELASGCSEPQAQECTGCRRNLWFSARTGKGKACRNLMRLGLVTPAVRIDEEPMMLTVSPSRLTAIEFHLRRLNSNPVEAVTEFYFHPNAPYPTLCARILERRECDFDVARVLFDKAVKILYSDPDTWTEAIGCLY